MCVCVYVCMYVWSEIYRSPTGQKVKPNMADMEALSYVAIFTIHVNMKDRVGWLRRRKLGPPLAAIFGFTRWPEDLTPDIYRAHWVRLINSCQRSHWYDTYSSVTANMNLIGERFFGIVIVSWSCAVWPGLKTANAAAISLASLNHTAGLMEERIMFLSDEGSTLETLVFILSVSAVHEPFSISICSHYFYILFIKRLL